MWTPAGLGRPGTWLWRRLEEQTVSEGLTCGARGLDFTLAAAETLTWSGQGRVRSRREVSRCPPESRVEGQRSGASQSV